MRRPPLNPSGCSAVPSAPLEMKILRIGMAPARLMSGFRAATGSAGPIKVGPRVRFVAPKMLGARGPDPPPRQAGGGLHVGRGLGTAWATRGAANKAAAGGARKIPAPPIIAAVASG